MRVVVSLRVFGFEDDPEQVARLLQVSSATFWRKGQLRPHSARPHSENGWEYKLETEGEETVETLAGRALAVVAPKWPDFQKTTKPSNVELSCVVYFQGDERPEIHFSKDVVRQLTVLNGSIDVDLYQLE